MSIADHLWPGLGIGKRICSSAAISTCFLLHCFVTTHLDWDHDETTAIFFLAEQAAGPGIMAFTCSPALLACHACCARLGTSADLYTSLSFTTCLGPQAVCACSASQQEAKSRADAAAGTSRPAPPSR